MKGACGPRDGPEESEAKPSPGARASGVGPASSEERLRVDVRYETRSKPVETLSGAEAVLGDRASRGPMMSTKP